MQPDDGAAPRPLHFQMCVDPSTPLQNWRADNGGKMCFLNCVHNVAIQASKSNQILNS